MDNMDKIKNIIEALLIVSEEGLSIGDFKNAMTDSDVKDIKEGIHLLGEDYSVKTRAFNIAEIAGKYRIVTKPEYIPWISKLYQKKTERLSGPGLETLALIAYKQPITRIEIEIVRGVNCGGVVKTLLDKELIQIKGRKDVPGRPLLYGITEKFLEIFGLSSLADLPALREFNEEDLEFGKPEEQVVINEMTQELGDREQIQDRSLKTGDTKLIESGEEEQNVVTEDEGVEAESNLSETE